MRVRGLRGVGGDEQRVAVWRGARDRLRSNATERTGAAVDDDRLPGFFSDLLADRPRQTVCGAACGGADDDGDRFIGVGLGGGDVCRQCDGECGQGFVVRVVYLLIVRIAVILAEGGDPALAPCEASGMRFAGSRFLDSRLRQECRHETETFARNLPWLNARIFRDFHPSFYTSAFHSNAYFAGAGW